MTFFYGYQYGTGDEARKLKQVSFNGRVKIDIDQEVNELIDINDDKGIDEKEIEILFDFLQRIYSTTIAQNKKETIVLSEADLSALREISKKFKEAYLRITYLVQGRSVGDSPEAFQMLLDDYVRLTEYDLFEKQPQLDQKFSKAMLNRFDAFSAADKTTIIQNILSFLQQTPWLDDMDKTEIYVRVLEHSVYQEGSLRVAAGDLLHLYNKFHQAKSFTLLRINSMLEHAFLYTVCRLGSLQEKQQIVQDVRALLYPQKQDTSLDLESTALELAAFIVDGSKRHQGKPGQSEIERMFGENSGPSKQENDLRLAAMTLLYVLYDDLLGGLSATAREKMIGDLAEAYTYSSGEMVTGNNSSGLLPEILSLLITTDALAEMALTLLTKNSAEALQIYRKYGTLVLDKDMVFSKQQLAWIDAVLGNMVDKKSNPVKIITNMRMVENISGMVTSSENGYVKLRLGDTIPLRTVNLVINPNNPENVTIQDINWVNRNPLYRYDENNINWFMHTLSHETGHRIHMEAYSEAHLALIEDIFNRNTLAGLDNLEPYQFQTAFAKDYDMDPQNYVYAPNVYEYYATTFETYAENTVRLFEIVNTALRKRNNALLVMTLLIAEYFEKTKGYIPLMQTTRDGQQVTAQLTRAAFEAYFNAEDLKKAKELLNANK